jgi:hypothetical protein
MAHLTENLNLQRGILRHLETIPEVRILENTKVISINRDEADRGGWPLVNLDNNMVIRARLLVRTMSSYRNSFMCICRLALMDLTLLFGHTLGYLHLDGLTMLRQSLPPSSILLEVHTKVQTPQHINGFCPQVLSLFCPLLPPGQLLYGRRNPI